MIEYFDNYLIMGKLQCKKKLIWWNKEVKKFKLKTSLISELKTTKQQQSFLSFSMCKESSLLSNSYFLYKTQFNSFPVKDDYVK